MPGLSGDQVLDEIRLREYNCQVVMVTAIKPDFDITEMDFDHYLVKPTTKDDLHAIVEKMLTRATYEDRTQELFALASKHATLKTHKSDRELQSSDEFRELEDRLITVKKQLHETAIEFEPDDFEAMW